jgi:hypothetical protein
VVPPLYSLSLDLDTFISAAGNFMESAKRLGPGFTRAAKVLLLKLGGNFRGKFIPYYVPFRLGGIGVDAAKGLLKILKSKAARLACRVPSDEEALPTRTVRYPVGSSREKVHLAFLPGVKGSIRSVVSALKLEGRFKDRFYFSSNNLLDSGHTSRYRKLRPVTKRKSVLLDLHSILCYYYEVAT